LNWSHVKEGLLASGDTNGEIYILSPTNSKWEVLGPYKGHKGSVEDVQWTPKEETVFATCGVDCTIKIWDTRQKESLLSFKSSDTDVNVIAWNSTTTNIIASGDEKGVIRSWDLKMLKEKDKKTMEPVAQFSYHTDQITGLEWSPYDSSILAACSSDSQTTIWDFSVEVEEEETSVEGIPAQLIFVHMGQKNPKEVHWHPQFKNVLGTTAEDSVNIFLPSNLYNNDTSTNDTEDKII